MGTAFPTPVRLDVCRGSRARARTSAMHTKLLIDAIVRQTTVLIAELSTAAGIRAPLAHVADQVFLELSRELEAQGLGKRVVADMFGLMIRGYQKKVQRLTESASMRDRSLWEAVLQFINERPGTTRDEVLQRFRRDNEDDVAAVLRDLTSTGLVFSSGQGRSCVYRPTSAEDRRALLKDDSFDSLVSMVWATLFHHPGSSLDDVARLLKLDATEVQPAVEQLRADGRVQANGGDQWSELSARELLVPVDSEQGWEAAVFDHFQAVSNAIGAKLRRRMLRATKRDVVGGATLRFELADDNPHRERVLNLLAEVRALVNSVWDDVRVHNESHPVDPENVTNVCFYFGQYLTEPDDE